MTVLDVRPQEEFAAGHIEGAINIPIRELVRRLPEVGRAREVVAYCRGPYCVMAFEAVAKLRDRGFRVRRLLDGYPEWRLAGLPVAAGISHKWTGRRQHKIPENLSRKAPPQKGLAQRPPNQNLE